MRLRKRIKRTLTINRRIGKKKSKNIIRRIKKLSIKLYKNLR